MFKHALVRDAAYESLGRAARERVHARIAGALEERFPEVVKDAAGAAGAPPRGGGAEGGRRCRYAQRAAQQGLERSAYAEAIAHACAMWWSGWERLPRPRAVEAELTANGVLTQAMMATRGWADPAGEGDSRSLHGAAAGARPGQRAPGADPVVPVHLSSRGQQSPRARSVAGNRRHRRAFRRPWTASCRRDAPRRRAPRGGHSRRRQACAGTRRRPLRSPASTAITARDSAWIPSSLAKTLLAHLVGSPVTRVGGFPLAARALSNGHVRSVTCRRLPSGCSTVAPSTNSPATADRRRDDQEILALWPHNTGSPPTRDTPPLIHAGQRRRRATPRQSLGPSPAWGANSASRTTDRCWPTSGQIVGAGRGRRAHQPLPFALSRKRRALLRARTAPAASHVPATDGSRGRGGALRWRKRCGWRDGRICLGLRYSPWKSCCGASAKSRRTERASTICSQLIPDCDQRLRQGVRGQGAHRRAGPRERAVRGDRAVQRLYQGDEARARLSEDREPRVSPGALHNFSEAQHHRRDGGHAPGEAPRCAVPSRLRRHAPIDWTPVWSLTTAGGATCRPDVSAG